jgi:HSP20 family protein
MALIKWSPYLEPFEEMEKFFEQWHKPMDQGFTPAVNVYETEKEVVVEVPLAGIDPADVEISIEHDVLTIKGETKQESEVDEKDYYRKEIRSGGFFRSLALPAHVIADKAEAQSHEGLLKITIPKTPDSSVKKISINKKK